jgi:hypothetical protein
MRIDSLRAGPPVSSGTLHFCKRRSVFKGLGAKNCTFFRRGRLSGPGVKEMKAEHKELKAKAQGNENQAQGNENQAQGNANIESRCFNRLWQILVPGAPLTLTFAARGA